LSDRAILTRIGEARAALPTAQILIYTNGDYLTPAFVDELAQAGLSYMHISIHMKPDDVYSDLYAIDRISEICARIGRPVKMKSVRGGEFMMGRIPHPSMEMEIRALNYWKTGQDRGGLIKDMVRATNRTAPCFFPFAHFYVGYTGDVVPCCHLRGDTPEHARYRIGKVTLDEPIYLTYANAAAAQWRRSMVGKRLRDAPCATCTAGAPQAGSALERALIQAR
jgi:MoaA/NifB/PqqE/SkfB family radical SAM enzyme